MTHCKDCGLRNYSGIVHCHKCGGNLYRQRTEEKVRRWLPAWPLLLMR